jgi:hypothetical protein
MVFRKEIHDIIIAIQTAEKSEDPKAALDSVLTSVKALREIAVGTEDMVYKYECKCESCKIHCTQNLNHKIRDETYCEDAGSTGVAKWDQVDTEKVKVSTSVSSTAT